MCTNAKNDHTKNNLHYDRHNPKKFWDNLLKLWGSNNSKSLNTINLTDPNTELEIPSSETSDHFNDFFCNIAGQIQQSMKPLSQTQSKDLFATLIQNANNPTSLYKTTNEFSFRDLTNNEVKKTN